MSTRELILYATPEGALADRIIEYFDVATRTLGRTTAQTYPPHCTLTGFFHRRSDRADRVIDHLGSVAVAVERPADPVRVDRLGVHDRWIGLELQSAWLLSVIDAVMRADRTEGDEDALRPKDWLHLSLAYGVDDLEPYAELASRHVDISLPVSWSVAIWERHRDGGWTRHG